MTTRKVCREGNYKQHAHPTSQEGRNVLSSTTTISTAPRALRLRCAARYTGVSPSTFRNWVARGLMPKPHRPPAGEGQISVWYIEELNDALDGFPQEGHTENDDWHDSSGRPIAL